MNNYTKQYINGEWVDSTSGEYIDVINPATEEVFGRIAKGNKEDVDKAVKAADSVYLKFRNMQVEDKKSMSNRSRGEDIDEIKPETEEVFGKIAKGNKEDVDKAVKAADSVYLKFRNMPVEDKKSMLDRIVVEYEKRKDDIIEAITSELGSPK